MFTYTILLTLAFSPPDDLPTIIADRIELCVVLDPKRNPLFFPPYTLFWVASISYPPTLAEKIEGKHQKLKVLWWQELYDITTLKEVPKVRPPLYYDGKFHIRDISSYEYVHIVAEELYVVFMTAYEFDRYVDIGELQ